MDTYLLSVGWWNFIGSMMMMVMLYQPFGQKLLVDWTKIFKDNFVLDYWGRLWLFWASGLNILFGLINIMAVKWGYTDVKSFIIWMDLASYLTFTCLSIWGLIAGRLGSGVYSVFAIFGMWMIWGYISVTS